MKKLILTGLILLNLSFRADASIHVPTTDINLPNGKVLKANHQTNQIIITRFTDADKIKSDFATIFELPGIPGVLSFEFHDIGLGVIEGKENDEYVLAFTGYKQIAGSNEIPRLKLGIVKFNSKDGSIIDGFGSIDGSGEQLLEIDLPYLVITSIETSGENIIVKGDFVDENGNQVDKTYTFSKKDGSPIIGGVI